MQNFATCCRLNCDQLGFRYLIIGMTLLCVSFCNAQNATIIGTISDAYSKETLPYANIFINNSTFGTTADANGNFELNNVSFGAYELVVSYLGFKSFQSTVVVSDNHVDLGNILLEASESLPDNANSTVDPGWEKQLKKFKKLFLGEDELAEQCEILNPYVIDFSKESGGVLIASANEPIEISNMWLGYKLSYHLDLFIADKEHHEMQGKVEFDEISTKGGVTALRWMNNREESFIGSQQHLFRSIIEQRLKGEGYFLYTDKKGFENVKERSSNFLSELGNSIEALDTTALFVPGNVPNTYKIILRGRIEIHCRAEEAKSRVYNDIPYAVSWMEVVNDTVVVNSNGSVLNPESVATAGAMSSNRIVNSLPLNYKPGKIIQVKKEPSGIQASYIEEKVYLHIDKPFYYPGEMMWFKAYLNYRNQEKRDSLSQTLYLELVNSDRKVVKSAIAMISNGYAHNNWVVTDTLSSGTYYLRAYTNLNRNFDNEFFVKPISILGRTEQVDPSEFFFEPDSSQRIKIIPSKRVYEPRDSIGLSITVTNQKGKPVKANLSISVTDARQVLPIKETSTILTDFQFQSPPSDKIFEQLAYPVERGINYEGQYFNRKNKPEKATLSILQGNFEHLSVIETDEQGRFAENGLIFYDSTEFKVQVRNAKRNDGSIEIKQRDIPSLDFNFPDYSLKINETGRNQRIISEYEVPRGARLLNEVLIQGRREELAQIRPYGQPDHVIRADELDISSNNLLQVLQGKVPGLVITQHFDETGPHTVVRIARASGLTINAQSEPLVMIDNVPMSGRAGDILQSLNVYTIESVEVVTRVNPSYGSAGVNGVISVYTKRGVSSNYVPPENVIQTIKLRGYTRPDFFRIPDYNSKQTESATDYRSILYWNPHLTIDSSGNTSVSFYAADLETRYRVVVEGITEDNEPVREVQYLTINQIKN